MLMNFSPITISMPQSYISQDETDILLEIDRVDGIKHRFTEHERRYLDGAALSELFGSAD